MKPLILFVLMLALVACIPCEVLADHCGAGGCGARGRVAAVRQNSQARRGEGRGVARLLPRNWGR